MFFNYLSALYPSVLHPSKQKVVFENKYGCRDIYNAHWLVVDVFGTIYIYPFDLYDQCIYESTNISYSWVIFNNRRFPIRHSGYCNRCKVVGKEWLDNNFIQQQQLPPLLAPSHVNAIDVQGILQQISYLSEHDKQTIYKNITEKNILVNGNNLALVYL